MKELREARELFLLWEQRSFIFGGADPLVASARKVAYARWIAACRAFREAQCQSR